MRRRALCVAVMMTCASWSAFAGDKEEAKQLFDAGLKLMHLDDFAGAGANFERSVALYPTQNSLFNLANCYKALQRYGDALAAIERLKRDFAGKLKPEIKEAVGRQEQEIESLVARLAVETLPADTIIRIDGKEAGTGPMLGPLLLGPGDHEIEAARPGYRSERRSMKLVSGAGRVEKFVLEVDIGSVFVRTNVAGTAVYVDGQFTGTTPLNQAVALLPGRHVLGLRAANYEDSVRAFDVQAGSKEVIDIALVAKPVPVPAPVLAPAPMVAAAPPAPVQSLSTIEDAPPKPRSRALRVVAWSSLAGAVVAGAVSGVFLYVRNSQKNNFSTYNAQYAKYGDSADDVNRRAAINDMNRSAGIAIGCGIAAGALAITALVTFLADSGGDQSKTTVSLSPVGLGVRF